MIPDTLFQRQLAELGACSKAREWVGARTFREAWAECDNVNWMNWLAHAVIAPRQADAYRSAVRSCDGHCPCPLCSPEAVQRACDIFRTIITADDVSNAYRSRS